MSGNNNRKLFDNLVSRTKIFSNNIYITSYYIMFKITNDNSFNCDIYINISLHIFC